MRPSARACAAALVVAGLASAALAQPKNHIGGPTAGIFVSSGCETSEKEAQDALLADGWSSSDFNAQAAALARDGFLVATSEGRLKLVNWGPCK